MNQELESLLIHPKTKNVVDNFVSKPSHALLLIGQAGSGKHTLAKAVASKLLKITPPALDSYPHFIRIHKSDDESEISIDSVRELIRKMQLKTVGTSPIRRISLIEDADTMSVEAQNSLLKVLEEPPVDTVFIIISPSEKKVLPTIASRAQVVTIHPVSLEQSRNYYSNSSSTETIERAWQLSRGSAGLLAALLYDNEQHPLKESVNLAKSLIRQSPYERLLMLDRLSKDKPQLLLFLNALNRVVTSLHHTAVKNDNKPQQRRLLSSRRLINKLENSLEANANPRLAVMHLAVNLSV